jgi:hypothetical protein
VRICAGLQLLLVPAIALAACGGGSSKTRSTAGATAAGSPATGASGVAGSAKRNRAQPKRNSKSGLEEVQAKHPQLPALSGSGGFDRSMVRVGFINTSNPFRVKSAVVYFVTPASGTKALVQAKGCVHAYLAKARSAYCFGFPSDRAFRFAMVSPRPPASMRRPCWSVYWGKPTSRRPLGSATNPAFGALHCPP